VVQAFRDNVASRRVHLPGTVVDVIAFVVERHLTFNADFAVSVAFADELDLADDAGFGLNFFVFRWSDVAQQRERQSCRNPQSAVFLCQTGTVHSHCQCHRDAAGCEAIARK
jgi:hypothetical protein